MNNNNTILRHIPNALTLTNIILGCLAITMAFERNFIISSYLIFAGAVIDFLDGFLARKLNASSELGKSLDSLADIVTFGVAPAFMILQLLIMSLTRINPTFSSETLSFLERVILYSAFLIPVFGAIRLARFNTIKSDGKFFRGLPIPAAGILIASTILLFAQTENESIVNLLTNPLFLVILILIISILMISSIKMFSLKFADFSFSKENQLRYLFITASLVIIVVLKYLGLPLVILLYLLLSILNNFYFAKNQKS